MVLERLRNETKEEHQQLERLVIPYIRNAVNFTAYARLLKIFYGYFMPVETQVAAFINGTVIPEFEKRRNAGSILADLQAIGAATVEIPLCTRLPVIKNIPTALGALYVLEGSTQGGKIISKMLVNNMQLPDTAAVKFFSGYGADSDRMWNTFTDALNNSTVNAAEQNEIVKAAADTFVCFKQWIMQQVPESAAPGA